VLSVKVTVTATTLACVLPVAAVYTRSLCLSTSERKEGRKRKKWKQEVVESDRRRARGGNEGGAAVVTLTLLRLLWTAQT